MGKPVKRAETIPTEVEGHLWTFGQGVMIGRCPMPAGATGRRFAVFCDDLPAKVSSWLDLGPDADALAVILRPQQDLGSVRLVELRLASGQPVARLLGAANGRVPPLDLAALFDGVSQRARLRIIRGLLGLSRAAGDPDLASVYQEISDFLFQPSFEPIEGRAEEPAGNGTALPAPPRLLTYRSAGNAASVVRSGPSGRAMLTMITADKAALLAEDLVLITGWAPAPLSDMAKARPLAPGMCQAGRFLCMNLRRENAGVPFIALLRLAGLATRTPARLVIESSRQRFLLDIGQPSQGQALAVLDPVRIGQPGALPRATDFLLGALMPRTGQAPCPEAEALLFGLLGEAGQPGGVIEIAGLCPGYGLLVQGWSRHDPGTQRHVLVENAGCRPRRALFARFAREDLDAEASGFVGLIEMPEDGGVEDLRRLHLRAGRAWFHLGWLPEGVRLPAATAHRHLQDILPRLSADADTLRKLRRVANAGFSGHETLSTLGQPVRLGIDHAYRLPGTGIFLSGWLLDPLDRVERVILRGPGAFATDLTAHWARTDRPDLNDAFAGDPLFAPHLSPARTRHGFLAFVPCDVAPAGGVPFHLEIVLADDAVGFVPLSPVERVRAEAVRHLLGAFDRNDPGASRLIARQLGPFIVAAGRTGPPEVTVMEPAKPLAVPRRAVLVPLVAAARDFDVTLASFAVDPDFAATEIIALVPAALGGPAISALWHQAAFYGLHLRLLVAEEALDACAALEIAARHAACDTLVFLSASAFGRGPGWLSALCASLHALRRPAIVSPTLLYEDDSIKFAGLYRQSAPLLDAAEALTSAFAGYPRGWLKGRELTPVLAASIECCALSRAVFQRLGGFSPEFAAPTLKSADFMLRARQAGVLSHWLPSVEMVALDERGAEESAYWYQNRLAVDRWNFGHKWSAYLAEAEDAA